eukprot:TRINITY_DN53534_c0_g1_i1.p1 TRINITY_DN53534_c0_g1~~TRINITY_DN53534_c0_g1_i1.p1  ORF type:complete len:269 (-),score=31.41 TRINITY_DN53534_c0_g1_i1:121-879(-)
MPKTVFKITGFGPFNGVIENPSNLLMNRLKERPEDCTSANYEIKSIDIIETSCEGVKEYFSTATIEPEDVFTIHLHVGVHPRAQSFQLETTAQNNATFRVPDERGNQFDGAKVVSSCDAKCLCTTMPLKDICDSFNNKCSEVGIKWCPNAIKTQDGTEKVQRTEEKDLIGGEGGGNVVEKGQECAVAGISDDAGLFLCNYCYFTSLHWIATQGVDSHTKAVFVHIPSQETVDLDTQYHALCTLLEVLAGHHC